MNTKVIYGLKYGIAAAALFAGLLFAYDYFYVKELKSTNAYLLMFFGMFIFDFFMGYFQKKRIDKERNKKNFN